MKVINVSYSDTTGGAARAAYRIHLALRSIDVNSMMFVEQSLTNDCYVKKTKRRAEAVTANIRPFMGSLITRLLKTRNPILHSPALIPSTWAKRLNNANADLIHLHWINNEMMSVSDISALRKPVVWTLHDMWAFCGAEHYTEDLRWRDGYTLNNRPEYEAGIDLNRLLWRRKLKKLARPINIVAPSQWLAECAKQSVLMRGWPISVVPNALDTNQWQPIDKTIAKKILDISLDTPLIVFGTFGANAAPHKGHPHLRDALRLLREQKYELQVAVYGQHNYQSSEDAGFYTHYLGHLHDDVTLRLVYSAADVMIVPSRLEAFGQAASEAMACGTPVVAFAATGLLDVVRHEKTGYLAKAYDPEDLANGIKWVLAERERHKTLCENARRDAVARFSYPVVAKQYMHIYSQAISS